MERIIHFDIMADNIQRAIKFYESSFEWKFKKWENPDPEMEYWLISTGDKSTPGINGGLGKRKEPLKGKEIGAFMCTIGVKDIDKSIQKVKQNGGKISLEKSEIPKVGWFAQALDTEGNHFGMMQMHPDAVMVEM